MCRSTSCYRPHARWRHFRRGASFLRRPRFSWVATTAGWASRSGKCPNGCDARRIQPRMSSTTSCYMGYSVRGTGLFDAKHAPRAREWQLTWRKCDKTGSLPFQAYHRSQPPQRSKPSLNSYPAAERTKAAPTRRTARSDRKDAFGFSYGRERAIATVRRLGRHRGQCQPGSCLRTGSHPRLASRR